MKLGRQKKKNKEAKKKKVEKKRIRKENGNTNHDDPSKIK